MTPTAPGERFPYVSIHIRIGSSYDFEQEIEIEALVDTGFDGGVAVPAALIDARIKPDTHLPWKLADGSEVRTPAYLATVQIGALESFLTVVIALGNEPLLGRDVTDRFRLILDHGKQVIIEP